VRVTHFYKRKREAVLCLRYFLFPIQAPSSMRGRGHTAEMPDKHIDTESIQEVTCFKFLVKILLQIRSLCRLAIFYLKKSVENGLVLGKIY
jgi:hypothetical protein